MTEKRQGPTQGVRLKEVSVRESWLYNVPYVDQWHIPDNMKKKTNHVYYHYHYIVSNITAITLSSLSLFYH